MAHQIHTFHVTRMDAGQMRELIKKHAALTWEESGKWGAVDFVVTGPLEALQAFAQDFAVIEGEWAAIRSW